MSGYPQHCPAQSCEPGCRALLSAHHTSTNCTGAQRSLVQRCCEVRLQGRVCGAICWGRRELKAFREQSPVPGLTVQSRTGRSQLTSSLLCLCPQPDLVERLISVDIGPTSTALISEFPAYISAMKSVNIPAGLSRSAARQLADSQLSSTVQVGNPSPRKGLLLLACSWDSAFLPAQC